MNRCFALMLCAALLAGGAFAQTNSDTVTTETPLPGFARDLRISAMIKNADGLKVGIVNTVENWNKFIEVGDTYNGVEVVEADYETEEVVLRKGDETIRLFLATDPNAEVVAGIIDEGTPTQTAWKGEGIESYLRDHPELAEKLNQPTVGMGEGIESVLRENPELAEKAKRPQVGLGEGIESYLNEHPELRNAATSPAVGMGEGIERALREQAELEKSGKAPAPIPTPVLTPPPAP